MNCNTTHYRANSSSVPGDPTRLDDNSGLNPLERADLESELERIENELTLINELQIALLPRQTIKVDFLDGGSGNDELHDSALNDILNGGGDDDTLYSRGGGDKYKGGNGTDAYVWVGTNDDEYIRLVTEADDYGNFGAVVRLDSHKTRENLEDDILVARLLETDIEVIQVNALGGNDLVEIEFGTQAIKEVRVEAGDGDDLVDAITLEARITVLGGSGNDTVFGGDSDDVLTGDEGNDLLHGGDGTDMLDGGDGNDFLDGGADDDSLAGGRGDDHYDGAGGNDVFAESEYLLGVWYYDGERVSIMREGEGLLTLYNENGEWHRGRFLDPFHIEATWLDLQTVVGTLVATPTGIAIEWSNDTRWERDYFSGSYFYNGQSARIGRYPDGTLLLINERAEEARAEFIAEDRIRVFSNWINLYGTLVVTSAGSRIEWSNNTVWERATPIAGRYVDNNNATCYIDETAEDSNGQRVINFYNALGQRAICNWTSPTTIRYADNNWGPGWDGVTATIIHDTEGRTRIVWSNGVVWFQYQP